MEERIMDLEVKVAFQEGTIAELDEVIRTLRDEVDALRREVRELQEQQLAAPADESEPPPHY